MLSRLSNALNIAARAHAIPAGVPIYLTEFGVQTNPPNRELGVSYAKQAQFDAIDEHIAWSNPRVAAFSQYLLKDDPLGGPAGASVNGGVVGFQTGLETVKGAPKPLYSSWPVPLTVTKQGHGYSLWGLVRPAIGSTKVTVLVKRKGARKYTHAEDRHDQLARLLELRLLDPGRGLARALDQPERREVRRHADNRVHELAWTPARIRRPPTMGDDARAARGRDHGAPAGSARCAARGSSRRSRRGSMR